MINLFVLYLTIFIDYNENEIITKNEIALNNWKKWHGAFKSLIPYKTCKFCKGFTEFWAHCGIGGVAYRNQGGKLFFKRNIQNLAEPFPVIDADDAGPS
jgi:outer membrane phospholipase A